MAAQSQTSEDNLPTELVEVMTSRAQSMKPGFFSNVGILSQDLVRGLRGMSRHSRLSGSAKWR